MAERLDTTSEAGVMPGGGKGALVKDERKKRQRTEGLAIGLTTPFSVQKLQMALHAKA